MLVLSATDVRTHLTPALALASMRTAMANLRDDTTYQPLRTLLEPPAVPGVTLLKPAAIDGVYGLKVASLFPSNAAIGEPTVQGFVVLLSTSTGGVEALIEAASLTELRTAAVSALATDLLARTGASRLGLIGSGAQARSHLLALREVRQLDEIRVASPTGAPAFVDWAKALGIEVIACEPEQLVRASDIVCTVTASPTPVLLGEWLTPGTHINAVGAYRPSDRELDANAIARSTVFVDLLESARAEAGAILLAEQEGVIGTDHLAAELGAVVTGGHPGRTSEDQITLFSSTGLAAQDVAAAHALVAVASSADIGVSIAL